MQKEKNWKNMKCNLRWFEWNIYIYIYVGKYGNMKSVNKEPYLDDGIF